VLPRLTPEQGQANLRALADSIGPRVWSQHLRTLRREGRWAMLEGWSAS
jgi:hypothetical protein